MSQRAFKKLLQDLAATGLVRVTGSYSVGTQTMASDIDFHVKQDRPDVENEDRNIRKIIKILEAHKLPWGSPFIGCVGVGYGDDTWLPIDIEFSDLFVHRPGRLKTITLNGVKFKTW